MKTAIVTGAGGFIGSALTERLFRAGYAVYGVDINETALRRLAGQPSFIPVCEDLENPEIASRLPQRADVVFHLALKGTMGAKDRGNADLQISNISSAVHFCRAVIDQCEHFIFCSSSYEFLRDKKDKRVPRCFYGTAKHAAADMCANIAYGGGKKFNKVIFTNTFGVGDRSNKAVNTIILRMLHSEPLTLVEGNERNDWTYIDDTVEGLMAVLEKGKPFRTYYIGHREITTFREKIIAMRDVLCPEMELAFGTMSEDFCVNYDEIDLDALYRDTGFECRSDFRESILKTANWLNSQTSPKSGGGGTELSPD